MRNNLLWQGEIGHLSLSGTIVRREALEQLPEALDILAKAEQVSRSTTARSEAAYSNGYRAGVEQGKADAITRSLRILTDAAALRKHFADDLVQVIAAGLDSLLDDRLKNEITDVEIRKALNACEPSQVAVISVAAESASRTQTLVEAWFGHAIPRWVTVKADPALQSGDVVFAAAGKVIDARLEARLQAWENSLREEIEQRLTYSRESSARGEETDSNDG